MGRFPMERDARTGGLLVLRRNGRQMKKDDEFYSYVQLFFSSVCWKCVFKQYRVSVEGRETP